MQYNQETVRTQSSHESSMTQMADPGLAVSAHVEAAFSRYARRRAITGAVIGGAAGLAAYYISPEWSEQLPAWTHYVNAALMTTGAALVGTCFASDNRRGLTRVVDELKIEFPQSSQQIDAHAQIYLKNNLKNH